MKWPVSNPAATKMGRAVKGRDAAWEVSTRSALHRLGFRFRKNDCRLPGKPDVVFPSKKLAVFLDSCFWHGCLEHGRLPKANRGLWEVKISGNRERDAKVNRQLASLGWRVLRIWGHEPDPLALVLEALGCPPP